MGFSDDLIYNGTTPYWNYPFQTEQDFTNQHMIVDASYRKNATNPVTRVHTNPATRLHTNPVTRVHTNAVTRVHTNPVTRVHTNPYTGTREITRAAT